MINKQFLATQFYKFVKYKALLGCLVQRDFKGKMQKIRSGLFMELVKQMQWTIIERDRKNGSKSE